ncbi:MAG: PepSY-like domain-containing protein [Ginsengibacter sp.]
MKKLFSFAFVLLTLGTGCFAQKNVKAPAPVMSSFSKDFPGATTKWEKEGANYEANFKQSGKSMSALYDAKGNRQETEQSIKVAELPQSVKDYIAKNYKGEKIKEAAIITKANGEVNYEAEVKGMDVLFSKDGKFIKTAKD